MRVLRLLRRLNWQRVFACDGPQHVCEEVLALVHWHVRLFPHLHVCDLFRLQFLFRGCFDRRTRILAQAK